MTQRQIIQRRMTQRRMTQRRGSMAAFGPAMGALLVTVLAACSAAPVGTQPAATSPGGMSHRTLPPSEAVLAGPPRAAPTVTSSITSGACPNSLLSARRNRVPPRRSRTTWRTVWPRKLCGCGMNGSVSAGSASAAAKAVVQVLI